MCYLNDFLIPNTFEKKKSLTNRLKKDSYYVTGHGQLTLLYTLNINVCKYL